MFGTTVPAIVDICLCVPLDSTWTTMKLVLMGDNLLWSKKNIHHHGCSVCWGQIVNLIIHPMLRKIKPPSAPMSPATSVFRMKNKTSLLTKGPLSFPSGVSTRIGFAFASATLMMSCSTLYLSVRLRRLVTIFTLIHAERLDRLLALPKPYLCLEVPRPLSSLLRTSWPPKGP